MSEDTPHILVVDDDDRLRDLLRRYLTEHGHVVITARDAADAVAKLETLAVDMIVLDVMMPGMNGLDLTRQIRTTSAVPILLLTAQGASDDRIAGLEAGADDYLSKPFEPRELLLRIGAVLRRTPQPVAKSSVVRLGRWSFDPARAELRGEDEATLRLTDVEASLLAVLAASPGQSFSRDDLSARSQVAVAPRSVDVQVVRLRRKIEDDPRLPRYLQTVRGEGYVLRPD
jgi:two-component system phosphate regulon response regulator OmpR